MLNVGQDLSNLRMTLSVKHVRDIMTVASLANDVHF